MRTVIPFPPARIIFLTAVIYENGNPIPPSEDYFYEWHVYFSRDLDWTLFSGLGRDNLTPETAPGYFIRAYVIVSDLENETFSNIQSEETGAFSIPGTSPGDKAAAVNWYPLSQSGGPIAVTSKHWRYTLWPARWKNNYRSYLTRNHDEIIQASPNYISSLQQKLLYWNGDESDIQNFNTFEIIEGFNNLYPQYWSVHGNVCIKNFFSSAGDIDPDDDEIEFKDPWLIDYDDPPYGMRNQGITAPFNTYDSPLNLTLASDINGVFLDQGWPNWDPPYYSVRAAQEQVFQAHGEDITGYFLNWEAEPSSSAEFQNADNHETAVVFRQDNAEVKARYKGHLVSSIQTATGANNGHRMAKHGGVYHLVYEDAGSVFYTTSTDLSAWEPEQLLSDGEGYAANPSIAVDYEGVHIVWAENRDNTTYLYNYEMSSGYNGYYVFASFSPAKPCYPVVETDYSFESSKRICVYEGPDGLYYSTAVNWWFLGASKIPQTISTSAYPSLQMRASPWGLAYRESSKIYYKTFNWPSTWGNRSKKSGSSYSNRRPSITAEYSGYSYYWIAYDGEDQMPPSHSTIVFRSKTGSYYSFSGWYKFYYYASIRSDESYPNPNMYLVFEDDGPHDVYYTTFNYYNSRWNYAQKIHSNGERPNIATNYNNEEADVVLTTQSSSPYDITVIPQGSLPKISQSQIIPYEYSRQITFDMLHHPKISNTGPDVSGDFSIEVFPYKLNDQTIDFAVIKDSSDVNKFFTSLPFSGGDKTLDIDFKINVKNVHIDNRSIHKGTVDLFKINIKDWDTKKTILNLYNFTLDSLAAFPENVNDVQRKISINLKKFMGSNIYIEEDLLKRDKLFEPEFVEKYILLDPDEDGIEKMADHDDKIKSEDSKIPGNYELFQNYPNPFNPETKIRFGLPADSNVKLEVFNIQGQLVKILVDGFLPVGYHTIMFNAASMPSGVYFYRTVAGDFQDIKRMLLIK